MWLQVALAVSTSMQRSDPTHQQNLQGHAHHLLNSC